MKKLLLIFALIYSVLSFAQDEFRFEDVVIIENTSKDDLYNRARNWFSNHFVNEKHVISFEDRNTGEISGNGSMKFNPQKTYFGVLAIAGTIEFKVNVIVKDGRYKYIFHSFRHEGTYVPSGAKAINYGLITNNDDPPQPSRGSASKKAWIDIKEQTTLSINKTIAKLKEAMLKQSNVEGEW